MFVKAERLDDFDQHLAVIVHRMLDIFAASGHQNYAKGARLYVQSLLALNDGSPQKAAVLESFRLHGSHAIRYSGH